MKNVEKYAKEIVEDASSTEKAIAVCKETMKPCDCSATSIRCKNCICSVDDSCENEPLYKWAMAEYIERPKISKKDRAFLDYLEGYKYMARDGDGELYVYITKPKRGFGIGQMLVSKVLQDWILIYRWSNGQMMNRGRLRI